MELHNSLSINYHVDDTPIRNISESIFANMNFVPLTYSDMKTFIMLYDKMNILINYDIFSITDMDSVRLDYLLTLIINSYHKYTNEEQALIEKISTYHFNTDDICDVTINFINNIVTTRDIMCEENIKNIETSFFKFASKYMRLESNIVNKISKKITHTLNNLTKHYSDCQTNYNIIFDLSNDINVILKLGNILENIHIDYDDFILYYEFALSKTETVEQETIINDFGLKIYDNSNKTVFGPFITNQLISENDQRNILKKIATKKHNDRSKSKIPGMGKNDYLILKNISKMLNVKIEILTSDYELFEIDNVSGGSHRKKLLSQNKYANSKSINDFEHGSKFDMIMIYLSNDKYYTLYKKEFVTVKNKEVLNSISI